MLEIPHLARGSSRKMQFEKIVQNAGRIIRGIIIQEMKISEQTFAREYKSYLEQCPYIIYNQKERSFTWSA